MTSSLPLTPDHAAALLLASVETLRREAEALGHEALGWHPAEGEWCFNEVVGHLIETEERGFRGQIERIIEQPGRLLPTWDPPEVAKERRDCEKDGMELLRSLEQDRAKGVQMVGTLTNDQLLLTGEHPLVGTLGISDLLHEWVHHDRNHVKQALSITQAYVWQHMGNAGRFAEFD